MADGWWNQPPNTWNPEMKERLLSGDLQNADDLRRVGRFVQLLAEKVDSTACSPEKLDLRPSDAEAAEVAANCLYEAASELKRLDYEPI